MLRVGFAHGWERIVSVLLVTLSSLMIEQVSGWCVTASSLWCCSIFNCCACALSSWMISVMVIIDNSWNGGWWTLQIVLMLQLLRSLTVNLGEVLLVLSQAFLSSGWCVTSRRGIIQSIFVSIVLIVLQSHCVVHVCRCSIVHIVVSRGWPIVVTAMCTALRVNIAWFWPIVLIRLDRRLDALNVIILPSWSVLSPLRTTISVLILIKNVAVMVTVVWRAGQISGTRPVIRSSSNYLLKPILSADQKLLLLPDNHSSPTDPHPSNQRSCIEAKLVHNVETD